MMILIKDPCGLVCIFLTYLAVFYADYVVIRWIIMQTMQDSLWAPFHVVLFNTVIFVVSFSHLRAMCSDPGAVPLPQNRMDFSDIHSAVPGSDTNLVYEDWTVCTRCETYRPPRAHHCRICKRCIRRMDHHCPWINNCVGEKNQKYFIQFLISVGVLSVYAFLLVVISWIRVCVDCDNELITVKQSRIVHCVILVMESILFGIFVMAILCDQYEAIANDETTIEQLQGPKANLSCQKVILSHICRLPCYSGMVVKTTMNAHSV